MEVLIDILSLLIGAILSLFAQIIYMKIDEWYKTRKNKENNRKLLRKMIDALDFKKPKKDFLMIEMIIQQLSPFFFNDNFDLLVYTTLARNQFTIIVEGWTFRFIDDDNIFIFHNNWNSSITSVNHLNDEQKQNIQLIKNLFIEKTKSFF